MSEKKYRLKKDLPDAVSGTILTSDGDGNYDYTSKLGVESWYHANSVEDSPEWFEEVSPERIQVSGVIEKFDNPLDRCRVMPYDYNFATNLPISKEKFPAIKQAIEKVLNSNGSISYVGEINESFLELSTDQRFDKKNVKINNEKYYCQSEMDIAMTDAFNAAREGKTFTVYESKILSDNVIYKTAADYLSSLSK